MMELKPGRYRHFKGNEYEVIGLATHSETEETVVVYRPLYGDGALWVRPLAMFTETVERDGQVRRLGNILFVKRAHQALVQVQISKGGHGNQLRS